MSSENSGDTSHLGAGCCIPRISHASQVGSAVTSSKLPVKHDDIEIPGGRFAMGDAFNEGYAADGELPVHNVTLDPFLVDRTAVTVSQFASFVDSSGYLTDAERFGSSAVFHLAVQANRADVLGEMGIPWWLSVRGADWRHPHGPLSSIDDLLDHPVVHISHGDALAYCKWAGRDLPTEAEWECAARGGLVGRRYPWGDDLEPSAVHMANIWQGVFPTFNSGLDGYRATAPAESYSPNGYGLFQMSGNVWEWCRDWFSPEYYRTSPAANPQGPSRGDERVIRGGSYLCHASYCNRYRVAARSSNTPESSAGNIGFRTVRRRSGT